MDRILRVMPTRELVAEQLHEQVRGRGSALALGVTDLRSLEERLLGLDERVRIGPTESRLLLGVIAQQVTQGEILESVAKQVGFVDAFLLVWDALRAAGIDRVGFERLARQLARGPSLTGRRFLALAKLAAAYEDRLAQRDVVDAALARQQLPATIRAASPQRLRSLLDGATRLELECTGAELAVTRVRMLQALAQAGIAVRVVLPELPPSVAASELALALEHARRNLVDEAPRVEVVPRALPELAWLAFAPERRTPGRVRARVRLLEAEDVRAELRGVCAEIRKLLHAGVAPHRITLAVPRLAWHRTAIVAALDVAEIPWQESRPRALLQQAAPLRLVGELLDAAERTLPREALATILESAYVAKPGAALVVRALREAGSRDDREPGHLARLRRHAGRLAAHGSEREREQAAKLLALADDWQRTFERLRLRERASIAEHLDALFAVLRTLGVPRRCLTMPSLGQGTRERRFERDAVLALARDRQALEALEIVGHGLVEAASKVGLEGHALPLADFRAHLEAALGTIPTPSMATSGSGVALRDLAEFAGSRSDHVFVLHAVEGELPGPGRALPFMDDDDRSALDAAAGRPVLPPHGAADALAFALACAGAREGLVIASHHQDAEGRELLPSRWFSALAKLEGTPTRLPAEVVAPLASCSTKGQVLARLGLRASSDEGRGLLALALARAAALAPTLAWIRARTHDGARARVRLAPHALALAHAVLDFDPTGARASQPEQAGLTWSGSSTALEHYASCPFRLFASRVLRVRPLPSTRDELDALEQGKVRHEVLAEVMQALRSAGLTPLRGGDQAWQEDELALDVCGRVLDEWAVRQRTGPRALWILQRDLVVRDLLRVLEGERRVAIEAWQPELFECGFGLPSPRDPSVLEGEPLAIRSRDGKRRFELVGRVDRVDLRGDGREREGLVIDYKSGRVGERLRYDQLARTQLQLPLYAAWLAAARPELGHTDAAYVSLRDGERSKVSMLDLVLSSVELDGLLELDPERRAALRERARSEAEPGAPLGAPLVARGALELPAAGQRNLADNVWALLGGIAEGHFDVRPFEPGRTCSLCPYAVVCRIERGDELAGPAASSEEPEA